jgi:dTDP-4-amino-4,6-dideoxy-D-glucose acyltransferase
MSGFLSREELLDLGFKRVGKGCQVSSKCSFYGIRGMMGDCVRIDDFCLIKGDVSFLSHNHIAAYVMVTGTNAPVILQEFAFLSVRCSVYSGSDNYGADALPAAVSPPEYTDMRTGPVTLGVNAWVGAHTVILPGVTIGDGASVGAGCIISADVAAGAIVRNKTPRWTSGRKRDVDKMTDYAARVLTNLEGSP